MFIDGEGLAGFNFNSFQTIFDLIFCSFVMLIFVMLVRSERRCLEEKIYWTNGKYAHWVLFVPLDSIRSPPFQQSLGRMNIPLVQGLD